MLLHPCRNTLACTATSWSLGGKKGAVLTYGCSSYHRCYFYLCVSVLRELKLRNYTPEDEELKERQVPKAKPASGTGPAHEYFLSARQVSVLTVGALCLQWRTK